MSTTNTRDQLQTLSTAILFTAGRTWDMVLFNRPELAPTTPTDLRTALATLTNTAQATATNICNTLGELTNPDDLPTLLDAIPTIDRATLLAFEATELQDVRTAIALATEYPTTRRQDLPGGVADDVDAAISGSTSLNQALTRILTLPPARLEALTAAINTAITRHLHAIGPAPTLDSRRRHANAAAGAGVLNRLTLAAHAAQSR